MPCMAFHPGGIITWGALPFSAGSVVENVMSIIRLTAWTYRKQMTMTVETSTWRCLFLQKIVKSEHFTLPHARALKDSRSILLVGWSISLIFLYAGLSKAMYPQEFLQALDSWTLIPLWSIGVILFLVPIAEVFLATAWLVRLRRDRIELAMLALVVVFSVTYGVHVLMGFEIRCGCMRGTESFQGQESVWILLGRNTILCLSLLFVIIVRHVRRLKESRQ